MYQREAQSQLIGEACRAGIAQIAINVLHNVGNVLQLMHVLINLIENARQAMDGVEGERTLHVAVSRHEGDIDICVRDCGRGIEASQLARIVSQEFIAQPGERDLGLHSCAVAAREMGGSLTAQSDGAGTGAAFTLRLPGPAGAHPVQPSPGL